MFKFFSSLICVIINVINVLLITLLLQCVINVIATFCRGSICKYIIKNIDFY